MKEIVGTVDSALVQSFLALMDYRIVPLSGKDNKPPPASQFLRLIRKFLTVWILFRYCTKYHFCVAGLLVPWTVFSLTWSVGSTCDYESRVIFSNWLRTKMEENQHKPPFPKEGLVYDYKYVDFYFYLCNNKIYLSLTHYKIFEWNSSIIYFSKYYFIYIFKSKYLFVYFSFPLIIYLLL